MRFFDSFLPVALAASARAEPEEKPDVWEIPPYGHRDTLMIYSRHDKPVHLAFGGPQPLPNYNDTTIIEPGDHTVLYQIGVGMAIFVNDVVPNSADETLIEFSQYKPTGRTYDVSFVNGYTVPIVCGCVYNDAPEPQEVTFVLGCNINLRSRMPCPAELDTGNACRNPLRAVEFKDATETTPFFKPCEHTGHTYVSDARGMDSSKECTQNSDGPLVCCVGTGCPRSLRQMEYHPVPGDAHGYDNAIYVPKKDPKSHKYPNPPPGSPHHTYPQPPPSSTLPPYPLPPNSTKPLPSPTPKPQPPTPQPPKPLPPKPLPGSGHNFWCTKGEPYCESFTHCNTTDGLDPQCKDDGYCDDADTPCQRGWFEFMRSWWQIHRNEGPAAEERTTLIPRPLPAVPQVPRGHWWQRPGGPLHYIPEDAVLGPPRLPEYVLPTVWCVKGEAICETLPHCEWSDPRCKNDGYCKSDDQGCILAWEQQKYAYYSAGA